MTDRKVGLLFTNNAILKMQKFVLGEPKKTERTKFLQLQNRMICKQETENLSIFLSVI